MSSKTRKRRGSLRKTALLGPGQEKTDQRLSSSTNAANSKKPASKNATRPEPSEDANLKVLASGSPQRQRGALLSPLSSSLDPYASTTDEDEATVPAPGSSQRPSSSAVRQSLDAAAEPSLAVPHGAQLPLLQPEEWDYSATERWGWVILALTWLVFVVGMGSCLGVWSWAWDVGETPYAPPELKDDPTLPIVGYYPALIVLTTVMAWVWVIVAWVGMKYFRHAKVQGDDT